LRAAGTRVYSEKNSKETLAVIPLQMAVDIKLKTNSPAMRMAFWEVVIFQQDDAPTALASVSCASATEHFYTWPPGHQT
jgi:hypothetical protein